MLITDVKEMARGSRLLSRPKLSEKYKVSRTTIDRAVSELIGEGYLIAKDGSGTYVSESDQKAQAGSVTDYFTNWGVILPDIRQDTYPGILRGIEDVANANNINIIICNSDNDRQKQNDYIYKLIQSRVVGIIMVPAVFSGSDSEMFARLKGSDIPLVFCNRMVDGVDAPRVFSNNFYGAYIATKHLLSSGYRRIAFLTRIWYSTSMERFQGYISALVEAGITPDESLYTFPEGPSDAVDEIAAIRSLIERRNPIDAVFCFNDSIAEKVYWELEHAGYRLGVDFGMMGYDNTRICEQLPIKLSSVRFKTYEIGSEAAKLMLRMTKGEKIPKNKSIVLQPKLEVRESSLKRGRE